MGDATQQVGRLAMRHEGNYWVAYYALMGTMDGALEIGRIAMAAVVDDPDRKAAFMKMMRSVVTVILQARTGLRCGWNDPVAAPEHERAGRA